METRPKNQNEQQKAFLIPIFIHSRQFWTSGSWLSSTGGGRGRPPENFCPSLKFGPKTIA